MEVGLSEKDREALEAVIKFNSVKAAAAEMGVSITTLSQRLSRMRLKAHRYEMWLKEFDRLKLQLPPKYVG